MTEERAYLTLREASRTLSVHEQTLRNWSRRGLIRLVRLPGSGHRRVPVEEVKRLQAQMARPESPTAGVRLELPSGDGVLAIKGRALAAELQRELAATVEATTLDEVMGSLRGRSWSS